MNLRQIALSLFLLSLSGVAFSSEVHDLAAVADQAAVDVELEGFFPPELVDEFHAWVIEHKKVYSTLEDQFHRMKIWLKNHYLIEQHNNHDPSPSYTLGHNQYSDMTHEEFKEYFHLGDFSNGIPETFSGKSRVVIPQFEEDAEASLRGVASSRKLLSKKHHHPTEIDWREKGAVTNVKNQGKCGSCWAFSATGAIEGSMAVNGYPLVSLAVQELVDCDKSELGCRGGLMDSAFIAEEGWDGMCSWDDYPYDAPDHPSELTCRRTNCTAVEGSGVKSFVDVSPKDGPCKDEDLQTALLMQPISVALQADQLSFMFYNSGIMDQECGAQLDHGVLAVGYGEEDGKKFWIVKNSWGEEWGEKGYIRLVRFEPDDESAPEEGQCGIFMMASYPEV